MKRKLLSLLLATVMLLGCVLPAFAEEAEATGESEELSVVMEIIEIQTAEEFLAFARSCILDTWSQNKQVVLTADISLAGTDFQPIATLGYPDAMFYTGVCYTNGDGVERDSVKAFRMFRSAANGKNIPAMHNLANCYMQGIGTKANSAQALRWYSAAADSGYLRSMSVLAKSYEEGILTEKSPEKAIEWYKRAAQKEEPYAMYKVARMYEHNDSVNGIKGKALRESETIKLYTRAATLRNPQAQMKLAEFYGNGRYVKKDKKKRFEGLQHAANNGLMEAQELVAECYEKGRGAEHNDKKAYQWYKRAAEQGSEYGKIKAKEFELFKFYK